MHIEEQQVLRAIEDRLVGEYEGVFARETIGQLVRDTSQRFSDATIRHFVPVIIERYTRERLKASGQATGIIHKEVPEILFVCIQNAGRSQMAAALLERHAKGKAHARCAGSRPADKLHDGVTEVMAEIGISMEHAYPKMLTQELIEAADYVVTMGCGDACPVLPGRIYEDWNLPDPSGMSIDDMRKVRSEIEKRVSTLINRLTVQHVGS